MPNVDIDAEPPQPDVVDGFAHRRLRAHERASLTDADGVFTRQKRSSSKTESLLAAQSAIAPSAKPMPSGPVLQILVVRIRKSSDIGSGSGKEHEQLRTVLRKISRADGWLSAQYDRDYNDLTKLYVFIREYLVDLGPSKKASS